MTIGKKLSLLISLAYIGIALLAGAGWEALTVVAYVIFPLACIWFSEEMGNYSGILIQGGPMTPTPRRLVAIGGWLLLLIPFIFALYALYLCVMPENKYR